MAGKLIFLGTGTSQGVPMIGCKCDVCISSDSRDKRLRSSVYVEYEGCSILVDAGPDFRQQMLREDILHLDAILLTHGHKDHTGGLDDVRAINFLEHRPIDIYCEEIVEDSLRKEYSYVFMPKPYPGIPEWNIIRIGEKPFRVRTCPAKLDISWLDNMPSDTDDALARFSEYQSLMDERHLAEVEVIPIRGMHYKLPVLGFRFGTLAYLTDMNSIPKKEFEKLKGLDVMTVNCVRHGRHISHFSFEEAISVALKVGAKRTYLTHLSHQLECHSRLEKLIVEEATRQLKEAGREVPEDIGSRIMPAYDGLTVTF